MKMSLPTVLIWTTLLLSGCDVAQLAQEQGTTAPTVIISPNTELQISDTETAHVVGYDECPDDFTDNPLVKHFPNGCINLGKEIQEVRVLMKLAESDVSEVWQVDHQGDSVTLSRPNGFQVHKPSS